MKTLSFTEGIGARVLAVIALFSLVAGLMPMQAFAAGANYQISGSLTQSGLGVNASGTASANTYTGQPTAQAISINWDFGGSNSAWVTIVPSSGMNFDPADNGVNGIILSTPWSASHTYNAAGTYTIKAIIHHSQPTGRESGSQVFTQTIIVVAPTQCNDGVDNADTEDTLVDLADPGCANASDNDETNTPITQCNDGVDNADTEDTLVDLADPGCSGPTDNDESNTPVTQCNDGVDNADTEDTLVDLQDPGCSGPTDNDESNIVIPLTQCNDGVDNADTEDTLVDLADPGCTDATDNDETDPVAPTQCNDGVDNADTEDTLVDLADPGCASAGDNDETDPIVPTQCNDGVDNADTEDTLVDLADPGCTGPTDNDESNTPVTQCNDGVDNADTEDTLVDLQDPGCSGPTDDDETNSDGGGDPVTCDNSSAQNFGEEGVCVFYQSQCLTTPANLLLNSSFEDPVVANINAYGGGFYEVATLIPNWVATNGVELWKNMFGGGSNATPQNVELDVAPGDAALSLTQSVTTIPGATYELRFDLKARSDASTEADNSVTVAADTTAVTSASTNNTNWVTYGDIFTALDASTDINFTDAGTDNGVGTLIDNANLCLVRLPEDNGGGDDGLSCTITADNTTIRRGRDVTLTWSSVDAVSASLSGSGATTTAGSVLIADLREDTTYTLTVTDDTGNTAECSVSIDTRSGGGGGGNNNNDNDDEEDEDGEVLGDSDDADPEGEVAGDQVSAVPVGAPNAGNGGTSPFAQTFLGIVPVAFTQRTRIHG